MRASTAKLGLPLGLASAFALLAAGCDGAPAARARAQAARPRGPAGRRAPAQRPRFTIPRPSTTPPPRPSGRAARPCPATVPEGMACVPGGTYRRGSDDQARDERPAAEVFVSTFLMDVYEVTQAAYEPCVRAGRCRRPMRFRGYMGPRQPVVAVSWFDADAACRLVGKRLPTEAEWERAASGPGPAPTRFPWGDAPLGCERAVVKDRRGTGCGRGPTWDVGSFPPGHFGLHDMAGNVWEWVADWYSPCYRGCLNECGDDCFGDDPRGPCRGSATCPRARAHRVLRGGSWWYPLERARAQARRGSGAPNLGPHRFGFRCARDL